MCISCIIYTRKYSKKKHPGVTSTDSEGNFIDYTPDFDYEVISSNAENFYTIVYVCDKEKIKIVRQN